MRTGRPPKIRAPWGRVSERRRPDGSIAWRLRGPVEGREVSIGVFDTLEDALDHAQAIANEQSTRPASLTVGGWVREWLDLRELAKQHRSVKSARAVAKAYIYGSSVDAIGLRQLQPELVRAWIHALSMRTATTGKNQGELIGEQTMRNGLNLLSAACRDAFRAGKMRSNPCTGLAVPKRTRTEETWTFLTLDEIRVGLACPILDQPRARNAGLRAALTVAIFSGIREGEIWGLHWHDVHLEGETPYLMIRYSYDGPTKGGRPRRVALFPPAIAELREWRAHQRRLQNARAAKGEPIPLRGLVWPAADGACHRIGYDARWPDVRDKAGIRPEVRFHDLRHTFASHLISGSWGRPWTIDEIQVAMGHRDRKTTERYAHLAPEARARAERETRERWDFGPTLGTGPKAR